ncbi:DUF6538 domain-containing protein [Devosia sp. 2618]|uniref:DUF6538 domain-containing protein n=1 Tax=Devosia sp. 2618 TaxID=3156454 RepID=UPI003390DBD3
MARGPHRLRRGAVYYWQRRLPDHLARRLQISHVKVNLRTKDVAVARRLVPPLDAQAMEVFMDERAQISREQLSSLFKAVLVEHQQKLNLLAALERANPTTERTELLDTELAQGLAYKLLSEQGAAHRKRWCAGQCHQPGKGPAGLSQGFGRSPAGRRAALWEPAGLRAGFWRAAGGDAWRRNPIACCDG